MLRSMSRFALGATGLLLVFSCKVVEDLQAVGPGVKLAEPAPPPRLAAGESGSIAVQVLDVNGEGVNGAYVSFARADATRLAFVDAPAGSDAVTSLSSDGTVSGVMTSGLATAAIQVLDDAAAGETEVFAILKQPADPEDTIALSVTVEVTRASGGNGGNGGNGGMGGSAPMGGSGGNVGEGGAAE